jgi:hypothetical protein
MKNGCTVLYCHLWPVSLDHIFTNYLINCTIFGKKLFDIKGLFSFLYNVCLKHFSISEEFREIFINNFKNLHRRTLANSTGRGGGGGAK